MAVTQIINGVPVNSVEGLTEAVRADTEKGQTKWQAVSTWKGGFNCETQIRQHTLHMDEPEGLGGTDNAPNMVEVVLGAYGSCLLVGLAMNASLRNIKINDIRVELEGDLDLAGFLGISEDVSAGFSDIRATIHLDSDASSEDAQALHDHVLKTSPVGAILTRPLNVSTQLSLT